ncbi:MAG: hypothetical protein HFG34_05545 [Eubacterium sp.]|nr:hypothetical protein [Eubacterium sp.]
MAEIDKKVIRSLSKLFTEGFDNEKAIAGMTMDDMLALPGVTVAEMNTINKIQKAVKTNKVIALLCVGENMEDFRNDK